MRFCRCFCTLDSVRKFFLTLSTFNIDKTDVRNRKSIDLHHSNRRRIAAVMHRNLRRAWRTAAICTPYGSYYPSSIACSEFRRAGRPQFTNLSPQSRQLSSRSDKDINTSDVKPKCLNENEDEALKAEEWAKQFEREVSKWKMNERDAENDMYAMDSERMYSVRRQSGSSRLPL